jgi:hypothetical protein
MQYFHTPSKQLFLVEDRMGNFRRFIFRDSEGLDTDMDSSMDTGIERNMDTDMTRTWT